MIFTFILGRIALNGIKTKHNFIEKLQIVRIFAVLFVALIMLALFGATNGHAQNAAKFRQYDRAVKAQQIQLNKTIAASRKCGFLLSSKCRRIKRSVSKMRANLRSLKSTRAKYAKVSRTATRNKNNSVKVKKTKRRTLLEQVFGVKTYKDNGQKINDEEYKNKVKPRRIYNTVRSLCVRTCDGYYFPVSFSTTKDRLQSDFEQCEKMCPGTETALFYHKMPSQDAEESISYRTGKPYASLENAFSYRKAVNPECSCKFSDDKTTASFEEIAGATKKEVAKAETVINRIGLPVYRQDPAQDPDTLDNENGRLDLTALEDLTSPEDSKKLSERSNSNIRIVGPAYFPAQ